jgi:hypothetical protein
MYCITPFMLVWYPSVHYGSQPSHLHVRYGMPCDPIEGHRTYVEVPSRHELAVSEHNGGSDVLWQAKPDKGIV